MASATKSSTRSAAKATPASRRIDERIAGLGDWRGRTLARLRAAIRRADPAVVEEWKWNVPVWSRDGILCTGETYKSVVKLTFARGAALSDPAGLFNASLEGRTRRAIDVREGEMPDAKAFQALLRAAVAFNAAKGSPPALLAGGNPQIPKGDGAAPVRAYLAAVPGWKRDVARRIDRLVVRTVPGVQKAVRWNSPFYGVEGRGWFLSLHCFTKFLRVTFLRGASLKPPPPGASKVSGVRYLDLREDEPFDEARLARWIRQAAKQPGDPLF